MFCFFDISHRKHPGHGNIGPDTLGSGFSRCERSPRRGHSGGMTLSLTNRIPNGSNGSTKTAACSGWEEPLGGTVLSLQALWFLVSGFCSESEVGGAPRCHALLWLTGGRPAMRSSPPGCRDPERKRRGSQHGCLVHRTPTGGAVACHAQALKG